MQHSSPGLLPGPPGLPITTNGTTRPSNIMPLPPHPYQPALQPSSIPSHPPQPPTPPTAFHQFTSRLTRSIQSVFSQSSVLLLSEEPNAGQLFEVLEGLTVASDQSLLYLIDTDGLLQMENRDVYAASLPLSMSSTREEYWRSSYDVMRQQWAVMDKLRSRHSTLKQAAADFWPAQPQPPPLPTIPMAEAADIDRSPAAPAAKQEEQMDDGGTAVAETEAANSNSNSNTAAMDGESAQHIDLTTPTTDNTSSPTSQPPQPPQPLNDNNNTTTQPTTADTPMADTPPADSLAAASGFTSPPQQSMSVLVSPAEASSGTERPEPAEAARSVMDLTDDG